MILSIVIAFLIYSGYREWMHAARVKDLELLVSAKTPQEYQILKRASEPIKRIVNEEENSDLVDVFEVDPEDFLKGKLS